MKNKIASSDPAKYPSSFKHVERNVRSLALFINAEEREDFDNHHLHQAEVKDENSNYFEEGEIIEKEDVE